MTRARRARARRRAARERPRRRGLGRRRRASGRGRGALASTRGRLPRRRRRRPSTRVPPPGRSPKPTRGARRRPNEGVLAQLLAGAERLEAALAVDVERYETPVRERAEAQAARTSELGAELRRLGAEEVQLRSRSSEAGERVGALDVELARVDAERDEAGRRLEAAAAEPAEGENRDELAERSAALRAPARGARPGEPAREGGVRGREGAPAGALGAARGSRASLNELEKLRDDLTQDRRDAVRRDVRGGRASLPRGRGDALPGRRRAPAAVGARGGGRGAGRRGRAAAGGQARDAAVAALRWREGARRDRVPVLAVPGAAEPVLPPRRGRGRARRHEHRALHGAAAPLRRPGAVHRDHAPEAHDGGGRRALRRHDGRRRGLADRLAAPAARGRGCSDA